MRALIYIFFFFLAIPAFAQQNTEFAQVKNYFGQHRMMIEKEFQNRTARSSQLYNKTLMSQDRKIFLQKLDSLENSAYQYALLTVRNREDLGKIRQSHNADTARTELKSISEKALYPGGLENLRQQIAGLLYIDAFAADFPASKADVFFTVEPDGSITYVHAEGLNPNFNKQAEIAIYRLPEKFTPAMKDGVAVRYKYRIPVTLSLAGK